MSFLLQLVRSITRSTMFTPFGDHSCKYISFKFRPNDDLGKEKSSHYRSENLGKSLQSTTQVQAEKQEKKEETSNDEKEQLMSMWQHHARMHKKNPDVPPRMDDLYYTSTDKDSRVYKQTWIDYPVQPPKKVKYDFAELEALSDPLFAPRPPREEPAQTTASTTDSKFKAKKSYMSSFND